MTSQDLTYTPTSVTIVVDGKEYVDYKPGMEWIVYALEFFRLSKLHEESIKLIKQSGGDMCCRKKNIRGRKPSNRFDSCPDYLK